MMKSDSVEVTRLLMAWGAGDEAALPGDAVDWQRARNRDARRRDPAQGAAEGDREHRARFHPVRRRGEEPRGSRQGPRFHP